MKKHVIPLAWFFVMLLPIAISAGCGGSKTAPANPVTPSPGSPVTPTAAHPPMAAFIQNSGNQRDLYVSTNDFSGLTKINDQPREFHSVYFLPDGSKAVFAAHSPGGYIQIYYLAPVSNTAIPLQLTTTSSNKTGAMLSADGTKVLFMQERNPEADSEEYVFDIAVMNTDGSDLHVIPTPAGWSYSHPFYSPDGEKIVGAMSIYGCFVDCAVFIMNSDGSSFTRLTPGGIDGILAVAPAFSPDGKEVVFGSIGWDDLSLYSVKTDGTGLHVIGQKGSGWGDPVFVGDRIIFVADGRIYSMKPDGTDVKPGFAGTFEVPMGL